ncbi:phage antirepressor KilAC domain-containing protein [Priestia megaterium]|uniref:Phage regulatory, Rha family protein n=1 Tax=Priestia megaterium (strain ATCC 14581 / DSM 32 / CCUG 1817 / JCM 2506 / NBRC 15308 / NCIMB 9376 / NCTC 10342 / NRRL B-14308 / VKM B-512 / Ford 19) TaxID=1348623 RepID=A0A0B6AL99_PRIM2|nr:phage antirepressor KilAC domain-containing protein [Priestia megaterium]AJI20584.1 phage regulatory, Rha family protein [Priestia megaterium NBRC 15308 = ATCC 14581]MDR4230435.1 Rha family transcriptional regulator [Priestia megaterium]MED3805585.1 phage antirepressor KilAC domain-containing protein [Priestia megaterium]MED4396299.1 phage antirepressor KilAC domain-containing protein [Priestia megaterium]MED4737132.1 phage antirepressor KilAC domain-containing protein [Priestia megaterium]
MFKLNVLNQNGQLLVDSREIAEMVEKEHKHLLRDIKNYLEILGKSNFGPADFFIESYYTDIQGKPRLHFLMTKKGCDMVANKLTGRKGVIFTATYVSKFEEMESKLKITQAPSYMIDDPIQRAQKWIEEQKEKQHLLVQNQQKDQKIEELQPKATYYDLILQTKSLLSVSQIAKDYGMSAISFNKLLHKLGIQYKQGDCWLLYQKYADKGYTHTKTHVVDSEKSKVHTYWTQKGRTFIYETLKDENVLPVIERMAS